MDIFLNFATLADVDADVAGLDFVGLDVACLDVSRAAMAVAVADESGGATVAVADVTAGAVVAGADVTDVDTVAAKRNFFVVKSIYKMHS